MCGRKRCEYDQYRRVDQRTTMSGRKTKMKQEKKIVTEEKIIDIGHIIYHIRCAEQTFQLGIREALKKGRPEKFL